MEEIGHAIRMDQGGTVKELLGSIPGANRRRERPRLRWLEDVGKLCERWLGDGDRRQWTGKNGRS